MSEKAKKIRDRFDLDSFFVEDEKTGKYSSKKIDSHIKEDGRDPFHYSEFYTDYSWNETNKSKRSNTWTRFFILLLIIIILIKLFL